MKSLAFLLVSLFIFGAVSADSDDTDAQKLDELVDAALVEKTKELRNIPLPDKELIVTLPFTGVKAGAQLRDGVIIGLEDFKRSDNSIIKHTDDYVEMSVHVGVEDVRVYMKANLYYKKPLYNVHINGALEKLQVLIRLKKDSEKGLKVFAVHVTTFDGFEMKIDAPGFIVDTFVNTALRATRFAYEPLVKSAVEKAVFKVVEEELAARGGKF